MFQSSQKWWPRAFSVISIKKILSMRAFWITVHALLWHATTFFEISGLEINHELRAGVWYICRGSAGILNWGVPIFWLLFSQLIVLNYRSICSFCANLDGFKNSSLIIDGFGGSPQPPANGAPDISQFYRKYCLKWHKK